MAVDDSRVDEILWNLLLILHNRFPFGLRVSKLGEEYAKWSGVSLSPSDIVPDSKDWRTTLDHCSLKNYLKVTSNKAPNTTTYNFPTPKKINQKSKRKSVEGVHENSPEDLIIRPICPRSEEEFSRIWSTANYGAIFNKGDPEGGYPQLRIEEIPRSGTKKRKLAYSDEEEVEERNSRASSATTTFSPELPEPSDLPESSEGLCILPDGPNPMPEVILLPQTSSIFEQERSSSENSSTSTRALTPGSSHDPPEVIIDVDPLAMPEVLPEKPKNSSIAYLSLPAPENPEFFEEEDVELMQPASFTTEAPSPVPTPPPPLPKSSSASQPPSNTPPIQSTRLLTQDQSQFYSSQSPQSTPSGNTYSTPPPAPTPPPNINLLPPPPPPAPPEPTPEVQIIETRPRVLSPYKYKLDIQDLESVLSCGGTNWVALPSNNFLFPPRVFHKGDRGDSLTWLDTESGCWQPYKNDYSGMQIVLPNNTLVLGQIVEFVHEKKELDGSSGSSNTFKLEFHIFDAGKIGGLDISKHPYKRRHQLTIQYFNSPKMSPLVQQTIKVKMYCTPGAVSEVFKKIVWKNIADNRLPFMWDNNTVFLTLAGFLFIQCPSQGFHSFLTDKRVLWESLADLTILCKLSNPTLFNLKEIMLKRKAFKENKERFQQQQQQAQPISIVQQRLHQAPPRQPPPPQQVQQPPPQQQHAPPTTTTYSSPPMSQQSQSQLVDYLNKRQQRQGLTMGYVEPTNNNAPPPLVAAPPPPYSSGVSTQVRSRSRSNSVEYITSSPANSPILLQKENNITRINNMINDYALRPTQPNPVPQQYVPQSLNNVNNNTRNINPSIISVSSGNRNLFTLPMNVQQQQQRSQNPNNYYAQQPQQSPSYSSQPLAQPQPQQNQIVPEHNPASVVHYQPPQQQQLQQQFQLQQQQQNQQRIQLQQQQQQQTNHMQLSQAERQTLEQEMKKAREMQRLKQLGASQQQAVQPVINQNQQPPQYQQPNVQKQSFRPVQHTGNWPQPQQSSSSVIQNTSKYQFQQQQQQQSQQPPPQYHYNYQNMTIITPASTPDAGIRNANLPNLNALPNNNYNASTQPPTQNNNGQLLEQFFNQL